MLKILQLSTFQTIGGAAVAANRLHVALQNEGISSSLLVDKLVRPAAHVNAVSISDWQKTLSWGRFIGERLYFLPYEKDKASRFAFSPAITGIDISTHSLVKEADIIHLHWVNFGFLSLHSLRKIFALDKPVVWTFHDMWPLTGGCHHSGSCNHFQNQCGDCRFLRNPGEHDLSNQRWTRKKEIYKNYPFAVVTCSHWLKEKAEQSSLLNDFNIRSIPNAIDITVFSPQKKAEAQLNLGLNMNKAYILFAAVNVKAPGKGYPYFQKAVSELLGEYPQYYDYVELLIMGKTDENSISDFPLKVNYLGYLDHPEKIAAAYSAATLFVIPSLEENLPNTIMESMACGTPVVGFNTGGIPEMIDHMQNGYVADYLSVESLRDGIRWVLEHPENLSANARQKVENEYAEEVVARQYIDLYRSLLNNKTIQ